MSTKINRCQGKDFESILFPMIEEKNKANIIATGLAMFSMFFGAGNVVFPLLVGIEAKDHNIYAILGLLLTAVGVPFLGLFSMTLFDGDYKSFFNRIGKVPGFLVAALIMGLIGPFGALPRCIALSHSTTEMFFPGMSLELFSLISCVLIFLLTFRKSQIVDVLGYYLTPLLLLSLAIIVVKGIIFSPAFTPSDLTPKEAFSLGFFQGYQTMDLLGAFFFSGVVIACLKPEKTSEEGQHKRILKLMGQASLIGALLLSLIYIGFSFVSAFNGADLLLAEKDKILGQTALLILGPTAGIVASIAVALACLTTAIALACVFAEFLHNDITLGKLGYIPSLIVTLIISYFVSIRNFNQIVAFLAPILEILYPALIVLAFFNILHKLYRVKMIKIPAALTLIATILYKTLV